MAIGGPRLDRPSAVGTEGRPRATSATLAALVVVALALAALWSLGELGLATLLGLAVMLQVAGLALLTRDSFGELVVGHLLYNPGAVFVIVFLVLAPAARNGVVYTGLFLSLFGVAATWANVLVREDLETASTRAPVSYVAMLGWVAALFVVLGFGGGLVAWFGRLLTRSPPVASVFGFLYLVAAAGGLVWLAVRTLPIVELSPRELRATRYRQVERVRRVATVVGAAAIAIAVLAAMVGGRTIAALAVRDPAVGVAIDVLSSPVVLGPVALVGLLAGLAALGGFTARQIATQVDAANYHVLAGLLAGFVLAAIVVLYLLLSPLLALLVFAPTLFGLALLAPPVVFVLGFLGVAAMQTRVLPDRAAGPAIGATGLVVAAIGGGLGSLPAPLVFALVAGAVLLWDLSTFGLGVTVELGHRPDTRRLELYHGVLSVTVGAGAVLAIVGIDWVRGAVGTEIGAWPAVGAAVAGAILLALARHGREA